ncbi:MAG: AarF/ABC1/UbiB kinase family protein [Gloeomargarita sp. SKYBB_i_bin120]|nr:AarF/ABC1/UbiB kinase family protein [Gloeomargarita sp. SKYB120]MDW8177910.1 AarF/ABC1/UbiB kinase family protein [Gloeomargarita sp. SKYBB_i_bin120]
MTVHVRTRQYRWNRERYSRWRRTVDIWLFVLRFLAAQWWYERSWSYPGGPTPEKRAARRRRIAIWVRESLLDLGPTFIKVGQLFSTRADIFPAEYVEELSKLQDQVPAFGMDQVAQIIETDLGKPIEKLFLNFEPTPLAAASLGQVHRAELPSGEQVVVKVQRPGLRQLFDIDLAIVKDIARYFQNHPKWGPGRDWLGIYEECRRILYEEIDYLQEGRNADEFRRNFRGIEWVKVPRVYWRYCSLRVLTLEYLPGIKISHYSALEAAGLDRKRLAELNARAYLEQVLNHGFFHADPHPGNIAVDPDGSLIFYDFGMMGRLHPQTKEKLIQTLMSIVNRDADGVIQALVELKALVPQGDMGPVRRSLQYILDHLLDKPLEMQSVAAISEDLYALAYDQPFRFPATFTFVMRAFSTLEGVGRGLDENFQFFTVATPYALQLMDNRNRNGDLDLLGELGRQAAQMGNSALSLPRRVEATLTQLERGDLVLRSRSLETERLLRRLSAQQAAGNYHILTGSLLICGTILLVHGYGWLAAVAVLGAGVTGWRAWRAWQRHERIERMF